MSKFQSGRGLQQGMLRLAGAVCTVYFLSACSSWPDASAGGEAETYISSRYYSDVFEQQDQVARLKKDLEHLELQYEVMVVKGAHLCLPASMKQLALLTHRVRRQISGDLIADAFDDADLLQKRLQEENRRLDFLRARTDCAKVSIGSQSGEYAGSPFLMSIHFDVNSNAVHALFEQRLQWLVNQLPVENRFIQVVGYTDKRGAELSNKTLGMQRAQAVAAELVALGVDPDSLDILTAGESTPMASDASDYAYFLNRRVDIKVTYTKPDGRLVSQDKVKINLIKDWERGIGHSSFYEPSVR